MRSSLNGQLMSVGHRESRRNVMWCREWVKFNENNIKQRRQTLSVLSCCHVTTNHPASQSADQTLIIIIIITWSGLAWTGRRDVRTDALTI